mmetsp:Transcript_13731/g.34812  ORF Transcript_13731/g.34812 Transcript_13731/m.34812 type:complete len:202 (+) Transcript_13731:2-607(+)
MASAQVVALVGSDAHSPYRKRRQRATLVMSVSSIDLIGEWLRFVCCTSGRPKSKRADFPPPALQDDDLDCSSAECTPVSKLAPRSRRLHDRSRSACSFHSTSSNSWLGPLVLFGKSASSVHTSRPDQKVEICAESFINFEHLGDDVYSVVSPVVLFENPPAVEQTPMPDRQAKVFAEHLTAFERLGDDALFQIEQRRLREG